MWRLRINGGVGQGGGREERWKDRRDEEEVGGGRVSVGNEASRRQLGDVGQVRQGLSSKVDDREKEEQAEGISL